MSTRGIVTSTCFQPVDGHGRNLVLAPDHGDGGRTAQLVGPVPLVEPPRDIRTDDHEELARRRTKFLDRFHRVGRAFTFHLDAGRLEAGDGFHRRLHHVETIGGRRHDQPVLLPRVTGDHEQGAIEVESFVRGECRDQVTDMNGIEGAAEDPEPFAHRVHRAILRIVASRTTRL